MARFCLLQTLTLKTMFIKHYLTKLIKISLNKDTAELVLEHCRKPTVLKTEAIKPKKQPLPKLK